MTAVQSGSWRDRTPRPGLHQPDSWFDGVPANVWEFHIGGYQVCEKWLKDRRAPTLSDEDILHDQRVVALNGTILYGIFRLQADSGIATSTFAASSPSECQVVVAKDYLSAIQGGNRVPITTCEHLSPPSTLGIPGEEVKIITRFQYPPS